jgi:rhamnosyltransferase
MSPYTSIIIPTKNGGDRLDLVLKALFKSKTDFDYEIIAIDSGSTDNTKEILSRYPVRLIEISPSSFSHGGTRNLGVRHARGDIAVFITQDAIPVDERWLVHLVKYFRDMEVAGVYGRQIPDTDTSPLDTFFSNYLYPDHEIVKDSVDPKDCILRDIFFSNVNSAIRRSVLEEHAFNEKMIMSEDQEWARRMLIQGRKIVYNPDAAVYHSHRYTATEIIKRNFDSGMSLKGVVHAPLGRSLAYEIDYLCSGLRSFLTRGLYRYLFIFPFYEFARMLGFLMGFHSRFLPVRIRKALSQNKIYWERQPGMPEA